MKRTELVQVRLSVQEREALEAGAKQLGLSLSAFVRMRVAGIAKDIQLADDDPVDAGAPIATEMPTVLKEPALRYPLARGRYVCPVVGCGWRSDSIVGTCPDHHEDVTPNTPVDLGD